MENATNSYVQQICAMQFNNSTSQRESVTNSSNHKCTYIVIYTHKHTLLYRAQMVRIILMALVSGSGMIA